MDDVVINKVATIERCLARVREDHAGDDRNLTHDQTRQDAIVLNIQRACEASIDLAMHLIRRERLGIPQATREAFAMLRDAGIIDDRLAARMMAMVGFRNVAIHDYQELNLEILRAIVHGDIGDVRDFAQQILRRFG
jgi:uncharacterized protein YutE (UPF0331/DUF86 family)